MCQRAVTTANVRWQPLICYVFVICLHGMPAHTPALYRKFPDNR